MSRNPLSSYVRAHLHRRIFLWFGLTILFTGMVVMVTMMATGWESSWRRETQRAQTFVSDRFERVWDDPADRSELARSMARDLDLQVRLTDLAGKPVEQVGNPDRHAWKVPILRRGAPIGYAYVSADRMHPSPWKLVLALAIAGLILWGASGKIARRLSRPFAELALVADAIGSGNFKSRVKLPTRQKNRYAGEVFVLATSINTMAEKIEKQFQDQRELLAAVSHEIRTPLARIRLLLELAREKGVDDESLGEVDREVVEMDALVAELLASSRLDFSALTMKDLDPVEAAKRALDREGLPASLLVLDGGVATRARADATLVARALANLLENAKAHGGGLTALRIRPDGDAIAFEAEDRGPGFTSEEASQVFDPFWRGKPRGDDRASPGLGLGLALVRRIAEAHGGRAYAEARSEGGARVGFTLHRAMDDQAPA